MGLRTPPAVQTHQFFEPRPAVATRRAPEGQKASNLDPRGSNFEIRCEDALGRRCEKNTTSDL